MEGFIMKCTNCDRNIYRDSIKNLEVETTCIFPYKKLKVVTQCPHCGWNQYHTIDEYLGSL